MAPYVEQPLRKLLGSLSSTISWLGEKGSVDVNTVPDVHLEPIKQLERIGVVHKRNNRQYELQKVRLKKLMDSMGMESLSQLAPSAIQATVVTASASVEVAAILPVADPTSA